MSGEVFVRELVYEFLKTKHRVSEDEVVELLRSKGIKERLGYYMMTTLQALLTSGEVELEIHEDGKRFWRFNGSRTV